MQESNLDELSYFQTEEAFNDFNLENLSGRNSSDL